MTSQQHVFLVRRKYNQWVNNQTLEDYALRFTAKSSRKWSLSRVTNTALGAISFLVLEAIGAAITLHYGFDNALAAILIVGGFIFLAGLPICYYAAKYGVDIDLLTRGASFGYLGSTATSLIYSTFTFIFFALEAAIMAKALELLFGLPLAFGYIISSVVVIPLVFYGITFISRVQLWSQPFWIILQILPFCFILFTESGLVTEWTTFKGKEQEDEGFNLLLIGSAASILFALVAQIGEQVDFLRFLPPKTPENKLKWWLALIAGGPGWIIIGIIKMLAGSFLAILALKHGATYIEAVDPTTMYSIAFSYVTNNSHLALILSGIFVVISQIKINLTNAYAGSIAWSNFFSRLTHNHPGRVVWLVFNVVIALLLMELGIYQAFEDTLSIYAIVAVSWVSTLVADLTINKPLGLSPPHIEFKRAHLYDINPVGLGSMILSSGFGLFAYLNFFGEMAHALAHFITIACSFIFVPLIAVMTKSKYYIARTPVIFSEHSEFIECCVCKINYEHEDIAHCPAYEGYICSLCCSLDSRCLDSCKKDEKITARVIDSIREKLPKKLEKLINTRVLNVTGILILVSAVSGILLALIYTNIQTHNVDIDYIIAATLWKVFFILLIVAGVISWLFVLAHESQVVAQQESTTQTQKLVTEIEAHKATDKKLQIAKEHAEAANNAKSRYLTGISHELRTPLNTVLGYAQLMEMDTALDKNTIDKISVIKRSSEHLADLIEGLLDISKIEAGRLDIHRNVIALNTLMNQMVDMFRLQAEDKGLTFNYTQITRLPDMVISDEKRLRQIIINLLSNAIKFTEIGSIDLSIRYRNQVAQIEVSDTGIGIPENEMERIFKPFERVRNPNTPYVTGTGLGLTITRLLVDIMGGDIVVKNNDQGGAVFTIWLMLSESLPLHKEKQKKIYGYEGNAKSVMVVDDDATHRGLICDLLTPLGFIVIESPNAESCLSSIIDFKPDIFLIDRLMPGMNGTELAFKLRDLNLHTPIIMVSANANEDVLEDNDTPGYDDYLIKPVKFNALLQKISTHLNITWIYSPIETVGAFLSSMSLNTLNLPDKEICHDILISAEIGHLSNLKKILKKLQDEKQANPEFIELLGLHIKEIRFDKIVSLLTNKTNG